MINNSKENLGKCPVCETGFVFEKEHNFFCSNSKWEKDESNNWINKGCKYNIYKYGLKKFGKDEITAREVKILLETGTVDVVFKRPMKIHSEYGITVQFKSE
jgi:hypothetical protein